MNESLSGLSTPEVLERRKKGEGGNTAEQITKTKSQIVRENVFTLFNFLNFLIAALLFAVGAYSNMLFIAIIILNIVIGIAQELKAKKLVDELSILNRPSVIVRRDGEDMKIGLEEIVKDDLMVLESGSQICNDAVIISGSLEVNESLLTGESDAIVKEKGAELLSGSSVISGRAYARVTHVGNENYAAKLANEVKKEKKGALRTPWFYAEGDQVYQFSDHSARHPAVPGSVFAARDTGRRGDRLFLGGTSRDAAEGTRAADLSFSRKRRYPPGEDEDPCAEYLLTGDACPCRYSLSR